MSKSVVTAVALHGSAFLCVVSRRADHSEAILERQKQTLETQARLPFKNLSTTQGYLELSSSHFKNKLHHRADSETGCAGGVDLVPNGVAVHLKAHKKVS